MVGRGQWQAEATRGGCRLLVACGVRIARSKEAGDDPVTQLEGFAKSHLRVALESPDASRIAKLELRNLSRENHAEVVSLIAQYDAALTQIIEHGAKNKLFAVPEPGLAARGVLALLDGVADWALGDGIPRERVERISWNMVRRAVGAKGFQ